MSNDAVTSTLSSIFHNDPLQMFVYKDTLCILPTEMSIGPNDTRYFICKTAVLECEYIFPSDFVVQKVTLDLKDRYVIGAYQYGNVEYYTYSELQYKFDDDIAQGFINHPDLGKVPVVVQKYLPLGHKYRKYSSSEVYIKRADVLDEIVIPLQYLENK